MKKHWKMMAATAGLCCMLSAPALADTNTSIYYDGTLLNASEPVMNIDGRVLLAFRDLFTCLEAEVEWNEQYRMARAVYGDKTVALFPDSGIAQLNGVPQQLDVKPQIINDRVYLPLRFVAQALGATVDYTQDAITGQDTITITTAPPVDDEVVNYAVQEGNLTTILREVPASEEKNSLYHYYVDDHGNLVELQSSDDGLTVRVIDIHQGEVTSQDYSTQGIHPAIDELERVNNTYVAHVNESTGSTYVGVGTPVDGEYLTSYETNNGTLQLYESSAVDQSIIFNSNTNEASGLLTNYVTGYVMDYSNRSTNFKSQGYAGTANGEYYAFLMDDYLTIIDYRTDLKADQQLDSGFTNLQLYTWDNKFIVSAVEDTRNNPELYVGVYDVSGSAVSPMHNISKLSRPSGDEIFYGYDRLRIVDQLQDENKLYFLLNNGWDRYVVIYNIRTNGTTVEKLDNMEQLYDRFIWTSDGVKLFCAGEDYYYIRDCE